MEKATQRRTGELKRVLRRPSDDARREVKSRVASDVRQAVDRSLRRNSDALRRLADF